MNRLKLLIVTSGGLGLAPKAPGTFGTLGGVAIAWLLRDTDPFLAWLIAACVVLYLIGRALAPWAEARSGKDPQFYVLDEVIGYLVTIAWVAPPSWVTLIVGFAVFRLFDITKPPPVRRFERIPGGDGILLDDVIAGLYGLAVMAVLRTLLPGSEGNLWIWNPVL